MADAKRGHFRHITASITAPAEGRQIGTCDGAYGRDRGTLFLGTVLTRRVGEEDAREAAGPWLGDEAGGLPRLAVAGREGRWGRGRGWVLTQLGVASIQDERKKPPRKRRERKRDTAGACRPDKGLRTAMLATPAHILSQTILSRPASTCRFGFGVSRAEGFYHMNYGGIKGHSTRLGAQRRPGRSHGADYRQRLWARFRER